MNTTFDSEKLSLGMPQVCPLKLGWLMCLVIAASLLLVGGCKKSSQPATGVDSPLSRALAKLNQSLQPPISPELQHGLNAMQYELHESHYSQALAAADGLANAPGLTDAEKKAIEEVRAQLKPLASSPPPATAPGQ
jgi:hypothetical protein